jgi:hypothetical protein
VNNNFHQDDQKSKSPKVIDVKDISISKIFYDFENSGGVLSLEIPKLFLCVY